MTSLGQDEETMHMTNEEKLAHTLGTKSGYIRGLGSGPKPKSTKYLDYYREQVDKEVSERVKSLRNEMQAEVDARVQEQLAEVRSEIQTQMRAEMQAEMQAFQTSFLQQVKNMGFSFTQGESLYAYMLKRAYTSFYVCYGYSLIFLFLCSFQCNFLG